MAIRNKLNQKAGFFNRSIRIGLPAYLLSAFNIGGKKF